LVTDAREDTLQGGDQAGVLVGDDQLDAGQPTFFE